MVRVDGRENDEMRPMDANVGYIDYAEGSVLITQGNTRVLCTATVDTNVPKWLKEKKQGWITAEYSMLPRSTHTRNERDRVRSKPDGRSQEIQRLIGRSLRSVCDLEALQGFNIIVDCDVIQADGGTRTASITGGFIALQMAINNLIFEKTLLATPILDSVSAISVGIIEGEALLDLCFIEDSKADSDFNIVMTGSSKIVEVQGSAEGQVFSRKQLDDILNLAEKGISSINAFQRKSLSNLRTQDKS